MVGARLGFTTLMATTDTMVPTTDAAPLALPAPMSLLAVCNYGTTNMAQLCLGPRGPYT